MRTNNKKSSQKHDTKRKTRDYVKKGKPTKYADAPDLDSNSNSDGRNDPSWYTANRQLVLDAGNFSFNTPAGAVLRGTYPGTVDKSFSGVCSMRMLMTPGISNDAYSPINIAARSMYDAVNYKNSRNFTYDAPDLMVYTYSVASAYSYWAWMQRAYGVMNTYSQINRYMPDQVVRAMGVDPSDIRLNMAQFRYYINLFARKINVFAVPSGMPIFQRYMWLYSNIYMDSNNMKAALYVTRPYGFYKFREDVNTGSAAQMVAMPKDMMKLEDIISYGDSISEALLASQDINNMSSDVLKAYENNVLALPDTAADYAVFAVYNEAVLNQFHNARALGDFIIDTPSSGSSGISLGSSGNLVQDSTAGHLLYTLELANNTNYAKLATTNLLLDTGIENPTPEDVFEMTRLITTTDHTTGDMLSCGADLIVDMNFYTFVGTGTGMDINIDTGETSYLFTTAGSQTSSDYMLLAKMADRITKFDWAPFIYMCMTDSTSVTTGLIMGDVFNYTNISYESVRKLHEAALLSMFTLPNTLGTK